jgi:hypothetical protein
MASLLAREVATRAARAAAVQMLDQLVPVITGKMKEIIQVNKDALCNPNANIDAIIDQKAAELKAALLTRINAVGGQRFRRSTRRHRTHGTRRRLNRR